VIAAPLAFGLAVLAGGAIPVEVARDRVEEARRALGEGDLERARELMSEVGSAGPAAPPADAPASERRDAARAAGRRLDAVEREIADVESAAREDGAPDRARAAVREILAERQFRPEERPPEREISSDSVESLLQRIENWLFRTPKFDPQASWLSRLFQAIGRFLQTVASLPWRWIGGAFLCALAAVLIRLALRYLRAPSLPRGRRQAGGEGIIAEALAHDAASLREEGLRLLARGDRRGALRAFYVGMLSALHRARLLALEPPKTNWEHVEKLRPRADLHGALAPHTRAFDFAWYGRREPEEAAVAAARATLDDFIARAAAPAQRP
jgi:hypothetical protein